MQKRVLLIAIAGVLFFIGLTVYLEIGKRNPTKNPSQLPSVMEQPSKVAEQPSNDASAGKETKTNGKASQIGITTTKKRLDDDNRPTDGEHGHHHSDDKEQHTENDEAGTTQEPFIAEIDESLEPYKRTEVYRASLIEHFGDIPQVHTLADSALKGWLGIYSDLDEAIKDHEAMVHLYPGPSDAAEQLEVLKKRKQEQESGEFVTRTETEPSSPEMLNLKTQYPELEQLVNQHGPNGFREAVRRFSELNPEEATAFKRALWNTPEVQNRLKTVDATELEEIKEFFGDIMDSQK